MCPCVFHKQVGGRNIQETLTVDASGEENQALWEQEKKTVLILFSFTLFEFFIVWMYYLFKKKIKAGHTLRELKDGKKHQSVMNADGKIWPIVKPSLGFKCYLK